MTGGVKILLGMKVTLTVTGHSNMAGTGRLNLSFNDIRNQKLTSIFKR